MARNLQFAEAELDRLVNEHEAADMLCYSVRALQNWRCRGGGPKFIKVSGRSVRYRRRDLLAWIEERTVSSTSQPLNT
ncbi:MAG: helix-turn-helix domain-containing protein [Rhodobacteraceae bacterium]|nr:helix-turn-helix domain-containing protein [Paracoccaceae bacterium]